MLLTTDDGGEMSFPFESVRKANLVYEGEI